MATATVSFRIDEALRDSLEQIAESLGRDRSWAINQALMNFVEMHHWQLAEIEAGIADTEAGRVHTEEEVFAQLKLQREARKAAKEYINSTRLVTK